MEFKKYNGEQVELGSYVIDFLKNNPKSTVVVGCDSNEIKGGKQTSVTYAVVVALFYPGSKGAHLLFNRFKRVKIGDFSLFERLWIEVETARSVAEYLESCIIDNINELDIDTHSYKNYIQIHLDVNVNEKYASNVVLNSSVGYLESLNFVVNCKPYSFVASCAADLSCRGGKKSDKKIEQREIRKVRRKFSKSGKSI